MSADDVITIKVDRTSKKIKEVNLPETCSLDPWAFDGHNPNANDV